MNKLIHIFLFLVLALLLVIFIPITITNKITNTNENTVTNKENTLSISRSNSPLLYYKCTDRNNPPAKGILARLGYKHQNPLSTDNQPKLFIPCTYTNAERELDRTPAEMISTSHIFMVQGCDILAAKDTLWQLLVARFTRQGAARIMPETYLTNDPDDMALFNSRHRFEKSYILKKNVQRKEGLLVIRGLSPNQIKNIIQQGSYILIQEYIANPLVINSRKLNLRVYIAVVCSPEADATGARINAYLYSQGKCIYTNKEYNPSTVEDIESQITSLNMDIEIYNYNPETLLELETYLTPARYAKMWKQLAAKLQRVFLATRDSMCSRDGFKGAKQFQLFGVDILLDESMEPWILEFNKGPDMEYKTENDSRMKKKLYSDLFCLVGLNTICQHSDMAIEWQKLM